MKSDPPFLTNIGIGLLLLMLFLTPATGCSSLFFYPEKQHFENPFVKQFPHEDVYFKTSDGLMLHGWLFRADPEAPASVLVLHGNAENISTHVNFVLWLVEEGFNVFIFDYRGYGWSEGKPSIPGIHLDAEAALETLMGLPGVDPSRIIVFGQSIGGAVAAYAVANSPHKQHIRALVIDSAFSSYRRIAREKMDLLWPTWPFQYPLSWFFDDCYSPVKVIAEVFPVPVFILHGMNDKVVPMHHGELLYQAARTPTEFWVTTAEGHVRATLLPVVRERLNESLLRLVWER